MTALSIGLVGFFGWGNFGDELFVSQWQATFGARARPVNDLLAKPYFSSPIDSVVAEFDILVVGGGDLIRTESISQLYWNRAWKTKPIVVSGIGVAAESGRNRPDVVERLRGFMHDSCILSFSVRDVDSRKWIDDNISPSFDVNVVPDLGFASLRRELTGTQLAGVPVVGLAFNKTIETADLQVRESLLRLERSGHIRLRHLLLATGRQRQQEEDALAKAGVRDGVETFCSVPEIAEAIAGCEYFLSAKFHGLVAALANGKRCWSLRDTSKARSLMHEFGLPLSVPDEEDLRLVILSRQGLNDRQQELVLRLGVDANAELARIRTILRADTKVGSW